MTGFADLAERIRAAPPRLGDTRLVCIDGPAGSGKTTFAGRLAGALGHRTGLVHMDDLYAGWTLTGAAARLCTGVLRPLADGRAGGYHRYDWAAGRFAEETVPVPVAEVLVVEGCGSSPRSLDRWTTLRIWVEAPQPLRLARGLARDGDEQADHWQEWQREEAALFAAEDTRARADLRVDGAGVTPAGGFVPLD
ncbi:uridine kinase [Blastococcus sp. CT_GayMR16]|uniref:uridine kinase family protein n=1 Tax=Blastococcus sp. CT_GayMR16 TaxID=2559607 RepID=UPI001FD7664B|nr:uridine kinase [Blastococcus sp. CT_GayMR16]